jgi:hypothetical protein
MEKLATAGAAAHVAPGSGQLVRNFAPSWFAAVMGTGVLALGTAFLARGTPALEPVALSLHWFNVALFGLLLVPWTLRWFVARPQAVGSLSHPVVASFVPTVAIALLVLSHSGRSARRRPPPSASSSCSASSPGNTSSSTTSRRACSSRRWGWSSSPWRALRWRRCRRTRHCRGGCCWPAT